MTFIFTKALGKERILQIKCSRINHELTLAKKKKRNKILKVHTIRCNRISIVKDLKKELAKEMGKTTIQLIIH